MDKLLERLPPELLLTAFAAISLVTMLWAICKYRHALRSLFISSVMGLGALLICYFFGEEIGCYLPLNMLHIGAAAVLGVPGVLLLLAMQLLSP